VQLLHSETWKFIAASREKARLHMRRSIGNGKDISLWYDPRLKEGALVTQLGCMHPAIILQPDCKVSDLIYNNTWHISYPSLMHIRSRLQVADIQAHEKNYWKCTYSSTRQFSLKSIWNSVRQSNPMFVFYNLIWFPSNCPKMVVCLLRAMQRKLLTQDKLEQYGIVTSHTCKFCNNLPESFAHLFFNCSYSRYIWACCKLKLGLTQQVLLYEEASLLQGYFRSRTKSNILARLVMAAAVWQLWKERNIRIFAQKYLTQTQRFHLLSHDVMTLIQSCKWKEDSEEAKAKLMENWLTPKV